MTARCKYFGTDGIRGTVGESPITPEFMLKLGWAVGQVLKNGPQRHKVLVGKDTRISGYMFESALESGLSAAGMDVRLLGPMPTPAIAYLTRTFHAQAGIVISASHNPYPDNGIKFFSHAGTKLADEVELAIESWLDRPMRTVSPEQLGKAERIEDAPGRYIEFCKSTLPFDIDLKQFKLVVDCAHGATYHIAPNVFRELGAEVETLGTQPNGLNINDRCGATYPQTLQKAVLELGADMGIALDGDGDRVIMVDHEGNILDGDDLLYIIAIARHQAQLLTGPVVGTLMSNLGLEQALQQRGIPFLRAKVGDRHVLELLQQQQGILGGETSGHLLCLDRTTTGDGIVTALQILAIVIQTQSQLAELKRGLHKYPQVQLTVPLSSSSTGENASAQDILNHPEMRAVRQQVEKILGNTGRFLLRPSGTEPVIRIMVEGPEGKLIAELAQQFAVVLQRIAGE